MDVEKKRVVIVAEVADRITVDLEQCGGGPCIHGMRIWVTDVLDLLANGLSIEHILKEIPDLEVEDIYASLRFAIRRLDTRSEVRFLRFTSDR